jgi:hypothetical protein
MAAKRLYEIERGCKASSESCLCRHTILIGMVERSGGVLHLRRRQMHGRMHMKLMRENKKLQKLLNVS